MERPLPIFSFSRDFRFFDFFMRLISPIGMCKAIFDEKNPVSSPYQTHFPHRLCSSLRITVLFFWPKGCPPLPLVSFPLFAVFFSV